MQKDEVVAIWMHDAAAKLFVGLQGEQGNRPLSRWVLVGKIMDQTPIGHWVDVQYLEERRSKPEWPEAEKVQWNVHPGQCLIRWEYIITAQRLEGKEEPRIGFL